MAEAAVSRQHRGQHRHDRELDDEGGEEELVRRQEARFLEHEGIVPGFTLCDFSFAMMIG
jgi:hypothetical protein